MDRKKFEMDLYRPAQKKSDCEVILKDVENIFGSIGNCFDTALDDKKSKMQVVGGIFGIGKSLLKFGWDAASCVVKHTPKAIATVANAKRELTDTIQEEYRNHQRQIQEDALDEKIRQLKYNKQER
ncbi:MAG: hypothetical protein LT067_02195 [Sulfurovum sp.]|nr:hypothetical protein [Sulfurovum sp.]